VRVFENKVLRRISGPKRDKSDGWYKLDQLHVLWNILMKIRAYKMLEIS
jgi:hypothetical protein